MTAKPKATSPQTLDTRSLGRPVHQLHDFAAHARELLEPMFRQVLNRRYRASYAVGEIEILPPGDMPRAGVWWSADWPQGRIFCLFERSLVLSVMSYRYGSAMAQDESAPETSTEARLHGLLGQQLLQGLALRLTGGDEAAGFTPVQRHSPTTSAWLLRVPVLESEQGLQSTLLFAIDAAWMNQLLRERAPTRNKPGTPLPGAAELAASLQLKLVARLLQTDLPLGELLELKAGSVIPVNLKATDVLVDGSRLFTACVAEHQGKLCLTSFEDAE